MTREFVVIPSFLVKWKKLGLNEDDMKNLETELINNPKIGSMMQSTGGVRKMCFAYENRGKSGSVRVIYIDFEIYKKLYLLDVYAKNEKDNLSKEERNDIKKVVKLLELSLEEKKK